MKKFFLSLSAIASCAILHAGTFDISANGTELKATYNGQDLIVKNQVCTGSLPFGGDGAESSFTEVNGNKVFNVWNANPDRSIRQEVAVSANGKHLDITYLTEHRAFQQYPSRVMKIELPFELFAGAQYTARVGRASRVKTVTGVIPKDAKNGSLLPANCRQVAFSGSAIGDFVIDFNVLGVGDFISDYTNGSFKGFGVMFRKGNTVELSSGTTLPVYGGHVGAKWRFYQGTDKDFDRYHAISQISYIGEFTQKRLYSFSDYEVGKIYTNIKEAPFSDQAQAGWIGKKPSTVADSPQGAYYGAAFGTNGTFRISGLNPGLYWITLGVGNLRGVPNNFSASLNGTAIADNISIEKGRAAIIRKAIFIDKESADLELKGNYIISTFGLTMVMSRHEDHTIRRGPWVVDGYEPATVFHNANYRKPAEFPTSIQTFTLPFPGKETAAPVKPLLELGSAGNPDRPNMRWRYSAKISAWAAGNQGTLIEYAEPEAMAKRLDELKSKGVNAVLVSGMLSRHTYPAQMQRAEEFLKRLADEAHKRGMRVIDHQDLTLLWNIDCGYRVGSERIDHANVAFNSMLTSPQMCLVNPNFKEHYKNYLVNFVRNTGIDCIMIDEVNFYPHSCGCGYCREQFFKDTGWYLPVNELDKRIGDKNSELWKRFLVWHKQQVGKWWRDMKLAVREVNPDFSFMAYSTHYGFTSNWSSLALGLDLTEFARGVDFLGTEIMTRDVLMSHRALIPFRKMKEVLTHEYNAPIFGLVYSEGKWDLAYFGWAVNNMNGQSTWETIMACPPGKSDYPAFKENMNYAESKRVAEAALLFPIQSREWNQYIGMLGELMGTAQTLEQLHIPYKMIGDMSLNDRSLQNFKLLYVGNANCLSDAQLKVIKEFAANGGTVITGATAGTQNEVGIIRSKWGFADVYGYDVNPVKFRKFNTVKGMQGSFNVKYSLLPSGNHRYGDCKVLYYAADGYPAVLEKSYGKGKFIHHAAMLAAPLADSEYGYNKKYTFKLDTVLDKFYKELLQKEFAAADSGFATDAPEKVYTTWYRSRDAEIIHLLNATGANPQLGQVLKATCPENPFPVVEQAIKVSIPAPAGVKSVYAVSPDFAGRKELKYTISNGQLEIILDAGLLKAYTIIWVKK
ncbi:MAG: hypothetical protein E7047_10410 [Lentisphaerae bacterium]|nr:hypothetical protein [Lentisphaerota bacterium]